MPRFCRFNSGIVVLNSPYVRTNYVSLATNYVYIRRRFEICVPEIVVVSSQLFCFSPNLRIFVSTPRFGSSTRRITTTKQIRGGNRPEDLHAESEQVLKFRKKTQNRRTILWVHARLPIS